VFGDDPRPRPLDVNAGGGSLRGRSWSTWDPDLSTAYERGHGRRASRCESRVRKPISLEQGSPDDFSNFAERDTPAGLLRPASGKTNELTGLRPRWVADVSKYRPTIFPQEGDDGSPDASLLRTPQWSIVPNDIMVPLDPRAGGCKDSGPWKWAGIGVRENDRCLVNRG